MALVEMLDKYYNTDCPCSLCIECVGKEECSQIEDAVRELEVLLKAFFKKVE